MHTSAILHKTRGTTFCGGFQDFDAHAVLTRKDLNSSELKTVRASRNLTTVTTANGEGANQKGSNNVRLRLKFVCDSKDPRGEDNSPITWKTLRRSRILPVDQWSKNHILLNTAENTMSLLLDYQRDFPARLPAHSQHRYRRTHGKSINHTKSEYTQSSTGRLVARFHRDRKQKCKIR